jgi:hypothetical protein
VTEVGTGQKAHYIETTMHKTYMDQKLPTREMNAFHTVSGFDDCYPTQLLEKLSASFEAPIP